tara:strand:- start:178 stop:456 length:279 start_codon:yes stop_codon:yes gene_type:complete
MFVRVNIIQFSSAIESEAMKALARYEMIKKLEGIISIEVFSISDTKAVAVLKFQSKEALERSRAVYIDNFKKNNNMKIESFEGEREFIVEKS